MPFVPVNGLIVDQIYRVDARISREIPFTERVKGYLQFEAFNVTNTPYNTSIRTTQYTVSAQTLTPVASFKSGSASQAFPDGTNARRGQVGLLSIDPLQFIEAFLFNFISNVDNGCQG